MAGRLEVTSPPISMMLCLQSIMILLLEEDVGKTTYSWRRKCGFWLIRQTGSRRDSFMDAIQLFREASRLPYLAACSSSIFGRAYSSTSAGLIFPRRSALPSAVSRMLAVPAESRAEEAGFFVVDDRGCQ